MFSNFEIDLVNAELAEIAEAERMARVDEQFEEMIEDLSRAYWEAAAAEHDMQMYACHSYDEDTIAYGSW